LSFLQDRAKLAHTARKGSESFRFIGIKFRTRYWKE
jgi:hypothetical protein